MESMLPSPRRPHRRLAGAPRALLLLWAMALAAPLHAEPDYVWLQRDGAQMTAHAGELDKPLATLPTGLDEARAIGPDGKSKPAQAQGGQYVLPAERNGDTRFAATLPGSDGVLTYYQARFGRAETKAVNDLELVPTEANGSTFRLFFKGRPVPASQVNVSTSEGWSRVLKPAADGSVSFRPSFPGLYVLEISARVNNASATVAGKKYDNVRHTATLSFDVQP